MEMSRECKAETRERKAEEKNVYTSFLTAGTVLFMVCLKQATVVSLVEQWRALVFLLLNILLLAIFFTSSPSSSIQICNENWNRVPQRNNERRRKTKQVASKYYGPATTTLFQQSGDCHNSEQKSTKETERIEDSPPAVEDVEQTTGLSDEELNERAEAFIAMFKKHLVLDARKGRGNF